MRLSIIVPFYNEKASIAPLLKDYAFFRKRYNFELLCVNNGSTDGSGKIFSQYLQKEKYHFITVVTIKKNRGYGNGIIKGVSHAKGDVIAWTHADMQTPTKDVFKAYDLYQRYNDTNTIVKGNRVGRPIADALLSAGMACFASILLKTPLFEINAQPKLFHKSFLTHMSKAPDDFSLDLFLLYKAKKIKYKIRTINVRFYKRAHGKSKWAYSFRSRLRTIVRTLHYIINLSMQTNE